MNVCKYFLVCELGSALKQGVAHKKIYKKFRLEKSLIIPSRQIYNLWYHRDKLLISNIYRFPSYDHILKNKTKTENVLILLVFLNKYISSFFIFYYLF